jgi:hypothetical protein
MSRQSLDLISAGVGDTLEKNWGGGEGVFTATLGTATGVRLQYRAADGTTWLDAGAETTLTADGGGVAALPSGGVRALCTGSASAATFAKFTSIE